MAYTAKRTPRGKDAYYLACWRAVDANGKTTVQYERYTGPNGKRGAQKLATLREAEAEEALLSTTVKDRMPVDIYLRDVWLPRITVGDSRYSTAVNRELTVRKLIEVLDIKPIGDITAMDFGTAQIRMKQHGLASVSTNQRMKTLKRAMRNAHEWGLIETRPWEGVKPLPLPKAPPRVVSLADGLRAADYLRDKGNDATADLIVVLAHTGCRLSEALGLHWEDVNWEADTIKIWRITAFFKDPVRRVGIKEGTKTSASRRTLPMSKSVREILERRKAASNNDLVFPSFVGKPLSSAMASARIAKAFKAAGVTGTAHGLRHGFITRLLERGVPLNRVSKLAGHSSTNTTATTYLAWADEDESIADMRAVLEDEKL
ncbi:tyrosine-type recombinase/integrase [Pelagimonas varians]|uniref:Tyrosine recombinase XerD n=1 Tax=Pelagimonas varians TaxID=696760 RepID=A0A238K720_9RHOB|nr:site-specific integrase [Pelagimonas varians]PYG31727.1 site-specific recombinase XerD [Pelagimonas varians]SMX38700.1 Tyrosine recombinase XerD [Pelagimonas varians]